VNTRFLSAGLCALLIAAAAESVFATGQRPPSPRPGASTAGTAERGNVTLTGCLYREDQFSGYKPDPAQATAAEKFILADARTKDPAPQSSAPRATGTTGAVPGTGTTYKIEKVPAERLKTLVGKRVEVVGRIDPEVAPGAAPTAGRMSEFEASAISEIEGTCAATPTA
jgi:hypothetical protein